MVNFGILEFAKIVASVILDSNLDAISGPKIVEWGSRGRRFESCQPDRHKPRIFLGLCRFMSRQCFLSKSRGKADRGGTGMIADRDIAERVKRLEALARELGLDAQQAQGQPEYASLLLDAIAVLVRVQERMRGAR